MLGLPPCSSSQSNTLVALTIVYKTMFTKVRCLQNARTLYRVFTEHPNIYTMFTITSVQKAGLKQRLYLQAWQRARRKEVLKIERCSSFLEMEKTPLGLGCMGDQMFPKSWHCQQKGKGGPSLSRIFFGGFVHNALRALQSDHSSPKSDNFYPKVCP